MSHGTLGDRLVGRLAGALPPRVRALLGPPPSAGYNQANRDAWVARAASLLPPGTRILDVGAGEGRYRTLFDHCDYRTQDFGSYEGTTEGLLKDSWHYGAIDYVSDATAIPVEDEAFDAVLCTEVIEHVPEPVAVLREIGRILRPGGTLFLSAPLASGLHQEPYHYYGGYTPHFYAYAMPQAGLTLVEVQQNGGLFLLVAQEVVRAADVIDERRPYSWANPMRWLVAVGLRILLPRWFARLEREIPVREFTADYLVTARKPGAPDR